MRDLHLGNGYSWPEIRLEKLTVEERRQLITLLASIQKIGLAGASITPQKAGWWALLDLLSEIFSKNTYAGNPVLRIALARE